jgi:hypothetical protein
MRSRQVHPHSKRYAWLLALVLFPVALLAQDQPFVPCPDCESRIHRPYPASGAWANLLRPGSGFNLVVQNGFLIGFYYGYDESGQPIWYLFNGPLVAPEEDASVLWTVEAPIYLVSGGNCFACAYHPPESEQPAGTIRLEFTQKNFASFQFDDGPKETMTTFLFASPGFFAFEEDTNYLFPELGADGEDAAPWLILLSTAETGPMVANSRLPLIVHFEASRKVLVDNELFIVYETLEDSQVVDPIAPLANIQCGTIFAEELMCLFRTTVHPLFFDHFKIPAANLSSNRFFGESESGKTVEGFRVEYD